MKTFRRCHCGCGRMFRFYPSKPRRYYAADCYRNHMMYLIAAFELKEHRRRTR